MKEADLRRAFTWLEAGPVTLVTTNAKNRYDIMTISWHMVMDFTPHIAISTGPWNESYQRILDTKECSICIPGADLLDQAVAIGTTSGSQVDKFKANGLTPLPGHTVQSPLIAECLAGIECRLIDVITDHGLLIFKGTALFENRERKEQRTFHANGDGTFFADGSFYSRRTAMAKWVPDGCERF
jgi:flavin reductase (DIM6/NTAB) family NADH-FMN oxidoreductase RutF